MDHGYISYPCIGSTCRHDLIIFVVEHRPRSTRSPIRHTRMEGRTHAMFETSSAKTEEKKKKRYAARIDALISRNDASVLAGGEPGVKSIEASKHESAFEAGKVITAK